MIDAPGRGAASAVALRVVREALVNVARHAGGTTAFVTVRSEPSGLHVEVVDRGGTSDATALGSGTGLAALAHAVDAAGGQWQSGPDDQGGFRVAAVLPLPAP